MTQLEKIMRRLRRMEKDSAGSATVEFVVTFPLLIVAFIFVFEFSQLFQAHQTATYNMRGAVRFLSRAPLTAEAIEEAENLARTGSPAGGSGAYDWMENMTITTTPDFATFTADDFRVDGQVIRMQARVPVSVSLFGLLNTLAGSSVRTGITLTIIEEARYIGD